MQIPEFAVVHRNDHQPAFNWWVKHVLKKRDRITASIRKQQIRHLKRSHKFGISLRLWSKHMPWILRMAIPNGQMQYPKIWIMSDWHLKTFQIESQHL